MSYCTVADVRAICDTDISDAEITNLITRTDARIAMKIDVGSVTAAFLSDLSSSWTSYRCFLKDPNARSLGEYSERRETAMKMLKDEIDEMLAMAGGGVAIIATMEEVV